MEAEAEGAGEEKDDVEFGPVEGEARELKPLSVLPLFRFRTTDRHLSCRQSGGGSSRGAASGVEVVATRYRPTGVKADARGVTFSCSTSTISSFITPFDVEASLCRRRRCSPDDSFAEGNFRRRIFACSSGSFFTNSDSPSSTLTHWFSMSVISNL